MSVKTDNQTPHPQTPDSYDAHMIPAETAARSGREGDDYKQVLDNAQGSDSLDTTGGGAVDKKPLTDKYNTIVDTFPWLMEAESVVLEMQKAGLDTHKISLIGKNYQDANPVQGALNGKDIAQAGGLAVVLTGLGISKNEASKHEAEIEAGKCVVLVMGSDEDISLAYQILQDVGHRISEAVAS